MILKCETCGKVFVLANPQIKVTTKGAYFVCSNPQCRNQLRSGIPISDIGRHWKKNPDRVTKENEGLNYYVEYD